MGNFNAIVGQRKPGVGNHIEKFGLGDRQGEMLVNYMNNENSFALTHLSRYQHSKHEYGETFMTK